MQDTLADLLEPYVLATTLDEKHALLSSKLVPNSPEWYYCTLLHELNAVKDDSSRANHHLERVDTLLQEFKNLADSSTDAYLPLYNRYVLLRAETDPVKWEDALAHFEKHFELDRRDPQPPPEVDLGMRPGPGSVTDDAEALLPSVLDEKLLQVCSRGGWILEHGIQSRDKEGSGPWKSEDVIVLGVKDWRGCGWAGGSVVVWNAHLQVPVKISFFRKCAVIIGFGDSWDFGGHDGLYSSSRHYVNVKLIERAYRDKLPCNLVTNALPNFANRHRSTHSWKNGSKPSKETLLSGAHRQSQLAAWSLQLLLCWTTSISGTRHAPSTKCSELSCIQAR